MNGTDKRHMHNLTDVTARGLFAGLLMVLLTACGGGGEENISSEQSGHNTNAKIAYRVTDVSAARFLEQSSFGPTLDSKRRLYELGFEGYLDEQFDTPPSTYAMPKKGDIGMTVLQQRFIANAVNGNDQLRQRMAYALGQIFVVSAEQIKDRNAVMSYQTFLLENAFNNYFDILKGVTLHPAMGNYLDLVNNSSADNPNENYARELMQLFSIGLHLLNDDGTYKSDHMGNPLPSYTQNDVEELARALTGWTFAVRPGMEPKRMNPAYYFAPMIPSDSLHDFGSKTIINGTFLPAGQSVEQDLDDSIRAIFMHENVAPFVSFRLIQHFVTSNPSPDYIQRVARVFNDNGKGVRGDMKAVIKAVLLDYEARRVDEHQAPIAGDSKLKDPVIFMTGLIRSLGATSNGYNLSYLSKAMGQDVLSPPSVFNYYPPDYRIPGLELFGPEFKILNSPEIVARYNFVRDLVHNSLWKGTSFDLTEWSRVASDAQALMDKLDKRLLRGIMDTDMKAYIASVVNSIDSNDTQTRARIAVYLTATSPQYFIQH